MTFEQLEYFCAAAQLGNFSRAAESVRISQPSLSIAMRKLEKELGVKLFLENRKGAVLTDAGRLFYQDARELLEKADQTVDHMKQCARTDRAQIRLAYSAGVADCFVPRLIAEFLKAEGAGCCIYSDEMPGSRIARELKEGRLDLGIGSWIPSDPEIEQTPICYQKLCVIAPPDEERNFEDPGQLDGMPLVTYHRDYPMYRQVKDILEKNSAKPRVVSYAYSEQAIMRLVAQGVGAAVIAQTEGLSGCSVRCLTPSWLEGGRWLYLMRHRTRPVTQAARLLEERILRERDADGEERG